MEMTFNQIFAAIVVVLCVLVLNTKMVKDAWTKHIWGVLQPSNPCFPCNKGDCGLCPTWNPVLNEVHSAYVVVKRNGKVLSTCTLTFKEDFVISQHPVNTPMDSFVGRYKTEIMSWSTTDEGGLSKEVSFS